MGLQRQEYYEPYYKLDERDMAEYPVGFRAKVEILEGEEPMWGVDGLSEGLCL